jgi:hypothetical protein
MDKLLKNLWRPGIYANRRITIRLERIVETFWCIAKAICNRSSETLDKQLQQIVFRITPSRQ